MIRPAQARRREPVIQGEVRVTVDSGVVFTTILGSCVATCLYDAGVGVGGMNHFLLPGDAGPRHGAVERYGVHLMELLVNGLMALGGRRARLEAKIFGGARVVRGLSDVGAANAAFAERFLRHEGISIAGADLGGTLGRRIEFEPTNGRVRMVYITGAPPIVTPPPFRARRDPAPVAGEIELFDA